MLHTHPGERVLKYASPIHSIPLWPNQPTTFTSHSIQAQVTPSTAFGFGLGFVSGGRRQVPQPKSPHINNQVDMWLHTRYQISKINFWYHMVYTWHIFIFGFGSIGLGIIFYFWDSRRRNNIILHTIYNSYSGSSIYLCFRATVTRKLELQAVV